MNVKLKKQSNGKFFRIEGCGEIKEVLVKENLFKPTKEKIQLFFKGKIDSGIIEFSTEELEDLYNQVKKETHLIKDFKIIK